MMFFWLALFGQYLVLVLLDEASIRKVFEVCFFSITLGSSLVQFALLEPGQLFLIIPCFCNYCAHYDYYCINFYLFVFVPNKLISLSLSLYTSSRTYSHSPYLFQEFPCPKFIYVLNISLAPYFSHACQFALQYLMYLMGQSTLSPKWEQKDIFEMASFLKSPCSVTFG